MSYICNEHNQTIMNIYLQTTAQREAREKLIERYKKTLQEAWYLLPHDSQREDLDAINTVLDLEWLYLRKSKEWLFNFKSGGWNSIMAADREQAIRLAKKEYKLSVNCEVDENTFRVRTEADYEQLMSLFY
jgi:hypothetical protein